MQNPNFPWGLPLNWQMLVYCFPSVLLVNFTRVFLSLAFRDPLPLSGVRKRKLRADLGIRIKLSTNFAIKAGRWSKNRYIIKCTPLFSWRKYHKSFPLQINFQNETWKYFHYIFILLIWVFYKNLLFKSRDQTTKKQQI